jgi:hypothetical protein
MSETKFTPGPWVKYDDDTVLDLEGETIAEVFSVEADTDLIAAAPDLYEALEHVLKGSLSLPRFAKDEAIRALAKARGEG